MMMKDVGIIERKCGFFYSNGCARERENKDDLFGVNETQNSFFL